MELYVMEQQQIQQALKQHFGFDQFRQGQFEVVSALLKGHSAAAIFPTGSGKSLCYQLTALCLPHLTLVISPLLALIQDQLDFLHRHGVAAARIDSTQSREDTSAVMKGLRQGEIKILMVSVERLKNERFAQFIKQIPISLLVVDEAHCISEWGHNFRPDYLKLPIYRQDFNIGQVLLLTATATPPVVDDMQSKFGISVDNTVCTGFYRNNLNIAVQSVAAQEKNNALHLFINQRQNQSGIVYVTLQKTAEQTAVYLQQQGINAQAYHAGMKNEIRQQVQRRFMHGEVDCIVATIAFGMGIDKNDIRYVVHYDLPKSIENYSQEIGRAGRDDMAADCLVLANGDNLNVLENFVYGDTPERCAIEVVLQEINQSETQWEVMLNTLSSQSNIRQLPLKTLLVYLEMRGIIKPQFSYFSELRFKLLISEDELFKLFNGERLAFIKAIISCSKKARTWAVVDVDNIYQQYGAPRDRVLTALEYLFEKNHIELESKKMLDVYLTDKAKLGDIDVLAGELHSQFNEKQNSEIQRIQDMVDFFESQQCLSQRLALHFGDAQLTQACGHCSVCAGKVIKLSSTQPAQPLAELDIQEYSQPLQQKLQSLNLPAASVELLTRYLCGITVPLLTRIKARSLPYCGALAAYRYQEVKLWLRG